MSGINVMFVFVMLYDIFSVNECLDWLVMGSNLLDMDIYGLKFLLFYCITIY